MNNYRDSFLMNNIFPEEQELVLDETITGTTNSNRLILFNDDYHTFDEVIYQVQKAIKCSHEKAEALTWEVHSRGLACVLEGGMSDCLRASSILEEIALNTRIEF